FEVEDYFRDVTLFKKNPAALEPGLCTELQRVSGKSQYFLAYQNGKSAARIHPTLLPNSVHSFDIPECHTLVTSFPSILHYLNFRVPFHLASRDAYCSGDRTCMAALYQEFILYNNPETNQNLIEKGILTRISYPSQLLSSL
ncbi:glycosyltransferase family 2 protein, partial [Synechococcus sp. W65.1]